MISQTLVKIKVWHRAGDKSLFQPIDSLVYWRVYTSLGLDHLNNLTQSLAQFTDTYMHLSVSMI